MQKYIAYFYLLILSTNCFAVTHVINAGTSVDVINSKINAAANYDVILLKTGSHYTNKPIVIPAWKSHITILGEGSNATFIRKTTPHNFPAIEIHGNYNKVDALQIDGGVSHKITYGDGITLLGQHNTVINSVVRNNGNHGILFLDTYGGLVQGTQVFYNNHIGIALANGDSVEIKDSWIYWNAYEGITIDPFEKPAGSNIWYGSDNVKVTNNWIHNNSKVAGIGGIGIDKAQNATIKQGLIEYNDGGGISINHVDGTPSSVTIDNIHILNNLDGRDIYNRLYGGFSQYANTINLSPSVVTTTYNPNARIWCDDMPVSSWYLQNLGSPYSDQCPTR